MASITVRKQVRCPSESHSGANRSARGRFQEDDTVMLSVGSHSELRRRTTGSAQLPKLQRVPDSLLDIKYDIVKRLIRIDLVNWRIPEV